MHKTQEESKQGIADYQHRRQSLLLIIKDRVLALFQAASMELTENEHSNKLTVQSTEYRVLSTAEK